MSIKLHKSKEANATPAMFIQETIQLGLKIAEVYKEASYYAESKELEAIGRIIRDCNGILGATGKIKNGCLYREYGLPEIWTKDSLIEEICDHAVPVTELVRQYKKEHVPLEKLIFSPVVRLRKNTNDALTGKGKAKKGFVHGFPLYRYTHVEIKLVTHLGDPVDPATWTDADHWRLVKSTSELENILHELNL